MNTSIVTSIVLGATTLLIGCVQAEPTLKEAFKKDFLIGAALNPGQFCESNAAEAALIKAQFSSISPENVLKWSSIHPQPGKYDFKLADRYVEFGESNGMFIIGHNLIWHEQTPDWVFEETAGRPVSREVLLQRMRDHISTVVGRYKDRIKGWDVVNEALDENGNLRTSRWLKIIGPDYLQKAFQFAHEADPKAELYYNDYAMENTAKRAGAVTLIRKLQSEGVFITGVGMQGHYSLTWPTNCDLDATLGAFTKLGVKVMITELDMDVLPFAWDQGNADITRNFSMQLKLNPYPDGLPEAMQQKLASRYAELFQVFLKHRDAISRVTFWGVGDQDSWLNDCPVSGRTSYPLLFDRQCQAKPAFEAVIKTAQIKGQSGPGN